MRGCPSLRVLCARVGFHGRVTLAQLTTRVKVKVCVIPPEVPVTVTEVDPVAASGVALKTTFCFLLDTGWIEAVTPLGRGDRAKVTSPLKTPKSVIVIVALAV